LVGCSWQANMDIELVTDPDACMMYMYISLHRVTTCRYGRGILWRSPAYSLFLLGALFFVPRYAWHSQTTLILFDEQKINDKRS